MKGLSDATTTRWSLACSASGAMPRINGFLSDRRAVAEPHRIEL